MRTTNPFRGISCMSRCEILALTSALSLALAEGLEDEDMEMLGNLLSTVGSMIATFGSICCESPVSEDAKPPSPA
ncbi:MAG: hypothetical protein FWD35_02320 [Oscillospiraceae bacterium]|nr:hypothetical protein [Oscillospiraceae bacterium]